MNITPSHSGTAGPHAASHAHAASHVQSSNSSLADFLLNSSANDGQDFQSIAAALFGAESSSASLAQAAPKESPSGRKSAAGPMQNASEARKSKDPADPASQPLNPALGLPLLNAQPPIDATLKLAASGASDKNAGASALPDLKVALENSALAGRTQNSDKKAVNAADQISGLQEKQALAATGKSPVTGNSADAIDRLVNAGVLSGKENAARLTEVPVNAAAVKKPAADLNRETESTNPNAGLQVPKPAISISQPIQPADRAIINSAPNAPPPVASAPAASQLGQASAASAKAILDSAIAARVTQKSGSINSGLATGSGNAVQAAPGSAARAGEGANKDREFSGRQIQDRQIKDQELKDRSLKDSKTASAQAGRFAVTQAGSVADGLAKPASPTVKEAAGVAMSGHSEAHGKQEPLKQSSISLSSQSIIGDLDAPDESVPTSLPSPVNAKFVQGLSQSEFRVGMQSQEFGNIDIRTSVARHMFSAQISVEHGDFAKSMTADLPALYHRLADQQVSVANIVIQGQHLATSSGLAQDSQPQKWQSQSNTTAKSQAEPMLPVITEALESAGRLDIRI